MPDNEVKFNPSGIEIKPEDMEMFMKFHIIDANGRLNMSQYQKWFMYSIDKKTEKNKKPEEIIKATVLANKVKDKALEDNHLDKAALKDNGGMEDNQYIYFLLKRVPLEDARVLSMSMVHDTLSNKKKSDGNTDGNLDDVVTLILPVIEVSEATGDTKKISDTLTYFEDELEKEGFHKKDIEAKIEQRKTKKTASITDVKTLKKKEEFNPYIDWRYLYYMYMLKADTRRIEARTVRMIFGSGSSSKHEISFEKPVFKRCILDMPYMKNINEFREKYGYAFDAEDIRLGIVGIRNDADYKVFFKDLFTNLYDSCKANVTDVAAFLDDVNSLVTIMGLAEGRKNLPPYGGLKGAEFKDFLLELRDPEISVTRMMEDEIKRNYGTNGKDDASLLAGYIHKEFMEKMNKDDLEGNFELMREAMAQYLILKNAHEERGTFYMIRHPFKYHTESNAIKDIENTMNHAADESKKRMFDEYKNSDKIYRTGADVEIEHIRSMSEQADIDNFEIVGHNSEQVEIPLDEDAKIDALFGENMIENEEVNLPEENEIAPGNAVKNDNIEPPVLKKED